MSRRERRIAAVSLFAALLTWSLVLLVNQRPMPGLSPREIPTLAVLPTDVPTIQAARIEVTLNTESTQLIVRFEPDASPQARAAYLESLGAETVKAIDALDSVVIRVPATLTALPPAAIVIASEPDFEVTALIDIPTSDPYFADQWALTAIGAPSVWAELPDDRFTVAVIDSGICANHPDLAGRILPGYDFVENDSTPQDEFGHGCSVAGVIAANTDNAIGIAGVAPNVAVLPLRVLNASGTGSYSNVAAAIIRATDQGAAIINLSLGGPHPSQTLADAVNYAVARDVLVIAAAGNSGTTQVLYPAAYEPVIAVGAVNSSLHLSSFSNYGPQVDVLAPGEDILTLAGTNGYASLNGTSLAAPYVAGIAALELARGNTLTLDGGIISVGAVSQPQPTPPVLNVPPRYDDLLARVNQDGRLRVIVRLNTAYRPEGQLSSAQVQSQRAMINTARSTLIAEVTSRFDALVAQRSSSLPIPIVGMAVDAETLAYLANSPAVVNIVEDIPLQRQLARSVPFIHADQAINLGFDGSGQAIAVIDDGIDSTHPFFGGRVVEEACFSDALNEPGFVSLCPNGTDFQDGPGAANSGPQCAPFDDPCDHGIHVAGIAAGSNGPVDAPNGVAPGASIIAVQVFTGRNDCASGIPGAQPCLVSYTFDQIDALYYVLDELSPIYDIAAVNFSLGTDGLTFGSVADCLMYETNNLDDLFTIAFTDLRDEGITPVVSAGNDADFGGLTFPACLPTAVSVSSVGTEFDTGPQNDTVSEYANNADYLDLFAPGGYINSSILNDEFEFFSGTSMAAPHVAGAWAIMRQANPNATPDEILAALVNTGVPVPDPRGGPTKPRINVYEALLEGLPTTLVVNTATDTLDNGICNASLCSLREAINHANGTPGVVERITFNIGGGGQETILLSGALGPLPALTDSVFIDATTQPGFSGAPLIELDGANLTETDPLLEFGLTLTGGSSLVRGLVINNFGSAAIHLTGGGFNLVAGNYLGTQPNGTTAAPNREGVRICSSSNNIIGGTTSADRNLISGNSDDGINLCRYNPLPLSNNNTIQGNYIGININGNSLLRNNDDGIKVTDATNTRIGGTESGAGNLISGNANGIRLDGSAVTGTIIQGNIIGPNAAGNQGMGFPGGANFNGIFIDNASNNQIGGTTSAARNLISGNGHGISFINAATNNIIQGNFLGTTITGTAGLPNQNQLAIELNPSANGNFIGGTDSGAGNVISGNQFVGIFVDSNNNTIQGNFIGTDLSGTINIGNGQASGITLAGNNNLVGGTTAGASNIIAYNDSFGVVVGYPAGANDTGNAILGNSIFGNLDSVVGDGLGIDLNGDNVTLNDEDDPDTGPNNRQNFPVLTVSAGINSLNINGTLNSTPNQTFRVELFGNDSCDPSGYGEGQDLFTAIDNVTTNGAGDATFSFETVGIFPIGAGFTATATSSSNNTSEFSLCEDITGYNDVVVVNTTSGAASDGVCDTHCSLRDAIAAANSTGGTQTIHFNIPGAGPHTIQPAQALATLADVTIDGTTQPGFVEGGPRLIAIDGRSILQTGFTVNRNVVIRGLAIHSFINFGLRVTDIVQANEAPLIEGNFIGTDATGTLDRGNSSTGILIDAGSSAVVGGITPAARNIISGNGADGIRVRGPAYLTTIQGNYIGTDITGTAAIPNGNSGILIESNQNIIGGDTGLTPAGSCTGACNLIAGNSHHGIRLSNITSYDPDDNVIRGNFIGTTVSGTSALPNGINGIFLNARAHDNVIGGMASVGNLIAGNGEYGVRVAHNQSIDNDLLYNLIGTTTTGMAALPNGLGGIYIVDADTTTVSNNTIAGNSGPGVTITGNPAQNNQITSNFIGLNSSGSGALANNGPGVVLEAGADNNTISDNVIAGNNGSGVVLRSDLTTNNTVHHNLIGTAADGTTVIANSGHGVLIENLAFNNLIGNATNPSNVIRGNQGDGVHITNTGSPGNRIFNNQIIGNTGSGIYASSANQNRTSFNLIGVDENDDEIANGQHGISLSNTASDQVYDNVVAGNLGVGILLDSADSGTFERNFVGVLSDGIGSAGNASHGFHLLNGATSNVIGGGLAADGNTIARNDGDGIRIAGSSDFNNRIQSNNIFRNSGLGIDLNANGVTPNDAGDSDNGANALQNYPVLTFASATITQIEIEGTFNSAANRDFRIEFFLNAACDPSGNGEGQDYLGNIDATTNGSGNAPIFASFTEPGVPGTFITATATNTTTGSTSEFSSCLLVTLLLNAPGDFTATVNSHSQVDLAWTDTNFTESGYVIDHSLNGGATWSQLFILEVDTESVSHTDLQCGSTHSYRARAVRLIDHEVSPDTAIETVTTNDCPTHVPPVNLVATQQSSTSILVNWQVATPGEVTTMHIERSLDNIVWNEIQVLPGHITTFTDSNLGCGTQYYYRVRAFRQVDSSYSPYSDPDDAITLACAAPITQTVGLMKDGRWYFWETNAPDSPIVGFNFGPTQPGWLPVAGDWDNDDIDGIGLYKDGIWQLRQVSAGGYSDLMVSFGRAESGWLPIVGDWNGDGTDGIGLYKNGQFILRQTATSGPADLGFSFGPAQPGWIPVAGDWNGSGTDTIGLFKDGLWLLSNRLPAIADIAPINFGQPGWLPVTGDWNEDGTHTVGIFKDGIWNLRNSNSTGLSDISYSIGTGSMGWLPIANYRGGAGGLKALSTSGVEPTSTPTVMESTPESTVEVTAEATPTNTEEPTVVVASETPTPTAMPTFTPTPTVTNIPTATETPTLTLTPSAIPPTATPEPAAESTEEP